MFQLKIIDYRRRANQTGLQSHYELVIDCELEPTGRKVQIVTVVTGPDELEDVYADICYVISAGNNAVENPD